MCHFPPGDPAGDLHAMWEEDPLWEDGGEVPELSCGCSSGVPTEVR